MITQTGLLIKVDEQEKTIRITRQSIERGSDDNICKDCFVIASSYFPQCDNSANVLFVNGEDYEAGSITLGEDSYMCIGKAFTTIIFPDYIREDSCFRYTIDVVL